MLYTVHRVLCNYQHMDLLSVGTAQRPTFAVCSDGGTLGGVRAGQTSKQERLSGGSSRSSVSSLKPCLFTFCCSVRSEWKQSHHCLFLVFEFTPPPPPYHLLLKTVRNTLLFRFVAFTFHCLTVNKKANDSLSSSSSLRLLLSRVVFC